MSSEREPQPSRARSPARNPRSPNLRRRPPRGRPGESPEARAARIARRLAAVPRITYPDDLPVAARRDDIAAAIAVLAAIDTARAVARARAWKLAGAHAPNHAASARTPLIVDLDATLVGSHSEKEQAAPTYKKGFGFHPLWSFVDHGAAGTGEPLSVQLRPGNAGSNTATDHIAVIKGALAQLPSHSSSKRAGRKVLIRTDSAGCTHKVLTWMSGQRLSYSVGFPLPHNTSDLLELIPADVWTPAYDAHDEIRDGAWVAELTGLLDMSGWPKGMRVIVRKERPHPGAQPGQADTACRIAISKNCSTSVASRSTTSPLPAGQAVHAVDDRDGPAGASCADGVTPDLAVTC